MTKCCIKTTSNKALQNAKNKISSKKKFKNKAKSEKKTFGSFNPQSSDKIFVIPFFDQEVKL